MGLGWPLRGVLLACVVYSWAFVAAYRRDYRGVTPVNSKKVVQIANNYRRYPEYPALIICWAIVIAVYIIVLDRAVNDPAFLGPKGSEKRNYYFQILSFVRTGLAMVHMPLMTTVLAATVPYSTMAKFDRRSVPDTADPRPGSAPPSKVTELFYLADRTWSGLIGWSKMPFYGHKEGGFSRTWTLLATIAALSYVGFPMLSIAYVSTTSQYVDFINMNATVRLGGLNTSFANKLETMLDPYKWMNSTNFFDTALSLDRTCFNVSGTSGAAGAGVKCNHLSASEPLQIPSAHNQTIVTSSPNTMIRRQLPLASIRASASCTLNNYVGYNDVRNSTNLNIDTVNPDTNGGLSHKLRCGVDCANLGNSSCDSDSSIMDITLFTSWNDSFNAAYFNTQGNETFKGQALSCIQQNYSDLQANATIVLAVQTNISTQVATYDMSIMYMRPMVNTISGSYFETKESPSEDIILNASPVQLLNLSIEPFINFFHQGPPLLIYPQQNCTVPPILSGFSWVSNWSPLCGNATSPVTSGSTPSDLLAHHGENLTGVAHFDERVFLGPLAFLINQTSFFENGTVAGTAFGNDGRIVYGKVPAAFAVIVLSLPVLCTCALSVATIVQRRWTPS